jgi:DNA-binding CsgD family transcriptional regulator
MFESSDLDGVVIPPDLSVRVRQTLRGLLRGLSEKQIAAELGISQHTVHVYIKHLYVRFEVNARSELLALWISPPPPPVWTAGSTSRSADRDAELDRLKRERLALSRQLADVDQRIAMTTDVISALKRAPRIGP